MFPAKDSKSCATPNTTVHQGRQNVLGHHKQGNAHPQARRPLALEWEGRGHGRRSSAGLRLVSPHPGRGQLSTAARAASVSSSAKQGTGGVSSSRSSRLCKDSVSSSVLRRCWLLEEALLSPGDSPTVPWGAPQLSPWGRSPLPPGEAPPLPPEGSPAVPSGGGGPCCPLRGLHGCPLGGSPAVPWGAPQLPPHGRPPGCQEYQPHHVWNAKTKTPQVRFYEALAPRLQVENRFTRFWDRLVPKLLLKRHLPPQHPLPPSVTLGPAPAPHLLYNRPRGLALGEPRPPWNHSRPPAPAAPSPPARGLCWAATSGSSPTPRGSPLQIPTPAGTSLEGTGCPQQPPPGPTAAHTVSAHGCRRTGRIRSRVNLQWDFSFSGCE